jgi:hypothetical protein
MLKEASITRMRSSPAAPARVTADVMVAVRWMP